MMSNSIDPGSRGTAGIVARETPPQLKMNILNQVAPPFRVGFIGPGDSFDCPAVANDRLAVEIVLAPLSGRNGIDSFHTQGSR